MVQAFAKRQPRSSNDLRYAPVVFQPGDQNLVTRLELGATITLSDQVDRLRGAARQDNLRSAGGIDKVAQLVAGALIELGRAMA